MISFRRKDYMYSYINAQSYQIDMHKHNYYEIMYFISADANYIVENNVYPISGGDIIITRPNEMHRIEFNRDTVYERHFIQISEEYLKYLGINLLHFINNKMSGEMNKINKKLVSKYNLGEYFDKIQYYIVNRLPESEIMIKTYVIQLVVNINNAYKENSITKNIYYKNSDKIRAVIEYINLNIKSDLALDIIAENFYISKYHLCHSFKQATGCTIHDYITSRKIDIAKSVLANGLSPSEAAFESGFSDYSVFFKTFKKYEGISPSEFISQNINK